MMCVNMLFKKSRQMERKKGGEREVPNFFKERNIYLKILMYKLKTLHLHISKPLFSYCRFSEE